MGCTPWLLLAALLGLACADAPGGTELHEAPPASQQERFCAWFGDARDGVLYFGEAAFWSELRRTGRPEGDRQRSGPVRVGRFDLGTRRLLDPLPVAPSEPSGTWDVLAHPNGRVYFTTFFGRAGSVDTATGSVARFGPESRGLNELAPGPEGQLLATRYGEPGAVVVLDPEGQVRETFVLEPPPGYRVAAKSLAWDPLREEIWVNTDLLPEGGSGPVIHDARILDAEGRELRRFDAPELQFVAFDEGGRGFLALLEGTVLSLAVLVPGRDSPLAGDRHVLDQRFPSGFDFVQDLQPTADGGVVVTRWSGRIHRLGAGQLRSYLLPRARSEGLYYTAVLAGDHLCATFCGDASVVCRRVE